MKVDEDILKKDLLQLLREMELFDYYRGGKKLHLTNFSPKSAEFKEGQYANECNFHVIGECDYVERHDSDSEGIVSLSPGGIQRYSVYIQKVIKCIVIWDTVWILWVGSINRCNV